VRSTVAELALAIRDRQVSPVELARASLGRLERLGPTFNAVASLTAERALAEARTAETDIARGRYRGPLHGIPYGAKDLLAARGAPTTWGAEPFRDQVFDHDATVVRRLRRSGAVLVGKLAMIALAGGGMYRRASASLQGPCLNPWDRGRWTGGSSSGSGAAVAGRLVPFAIGSETGGSIIGPAAYCGVTGLRPTYGLVSRAGAMALCWTLDKLGPLARTAADCSLVLEAMAGRDRLDPTATGRRYAGLAREQPAALRIGFAASDFEEHAAEPIRAVLAEALRDLGRLGAELREAQLPEALPYGPILATIIAAEGSTAFAQLAEDGRLDQLSDKRQVAGLRAGLTEVTARDYLDALRLRTVVVAAFRELFTRVDVLVAPARLRTASPIDEPLDASRALPSERPGNTALIQAGNAAGLPAVSVPCGFAEDGLPVGLQLVGPPYSEGRLLGLAQAYQEATDWHTRCPPGIE
jgi:aspartyl-tRNA(Asn)/glutamyl-tRNA(Gln) amidotransferase subunit A